MMGELCLGALSCREGRAFGRQMGRVQAWLVEEDTNGRMEEKARKERKRKGGERGIREQGEEGNWSLPCLE